MIRVLSKPIQQFCRDERGTMIVEFVLVAPVLLWTITAMFSYWDVYRSLNTLQKAAYTVSDVISRTNEDIGLNAQDFVGYKKLLNYLIQQKEDAIMRVTNVMWDGANAQYVSVWSCSANGDMPQLSTTDLNSPNFSNYLPIMPDGDTVILLEAAVNYDPFFYVRIPYYGSPDVDELGRLVMRQFIVTRPRLAPTVLLESCT